MNLQVAYWDEDIVAMHRAKYPGSQLVPCWVVLDSDIVAYHSNDRFEALAHMRVLEAQDKIEETFEKWVTELSTKLGEPVELIKTVVANYCTTL